MAGSGRFSGREHESLYHRIQKMSMPEKIHLAELGNKEARTILIREPVRQIQLAVIGNPRIKEGEIAAICRMRQVGEDVLRAIAARKEWLRLYPVRLALVQNPRTPLTLSLQLLSGLKRNDLRALARSRAVSQVIANAARRRVLSEDK